MVQLNPEIAIDGIRAYLWEATTERGYFYVGYEVDHETFMRHDIGSEFRGGTVIEGTGDRESDINNEVLVVRYGHPTGDLDSKRPTGNRWQDRKDCGL